MINERQLNYLDALGDGAVHDFIDAYKAQETHIDRLEKSLAAAKMVIGSQEKRMAFLNLQLDDWKESVHTLESEWEANGLLTERIAELEDQINCAYATADRETREKYEAVERISELERLLAAERERCAKVCESFADRYNEEIKHYQGSDKFVVNGLAAYANASDDCAEAIRNGETK